MVEYIALGHMKHIDEEQRNNDTPRYYIPHHAILKNDSITTKLRVVFDASCDTDTGVSLNDCLIVGLNLQQDFLSILLSTVKYVLTADIAQMYRQILIQETQTRNSMANYTLA